MPPVKIRLEDHHQGDTWVGMLIGPLLVNGMQPPNPVTSCRLQFRDSEGLLGYELNTVPATGKGDIVIEDAATWTISIAPQPLGLVAGKWTGELEITDGAGLVLTPYDFRIKIRPDGTHD